MEEGGAKEDSLRWMPFPDGDELSLLSDGTRNRFEGRAHVLRVRSEARGWSIREINQSRARLALYSANYSLRFFTLSFTTNIF